MSKRIAVSLTILSILAFTACPAPAQEDDGPTGPADTGQRGEDAGTGSEAQGTETPEGGEAGGGEGETPTPKKNRRGEGGLLNAYWLPIMLLGVLVLMYVWMGRSRKKQEQKRKQMISQLKKGDKIMSIGGVLGTVIEAKPDELVVKVDEANNVRMRFARWAVRAVGEEAESQASQEQPQR